MISALAVTGAFLIFFGMDFWVPIAYTWVTESFPTRARATGFAMADGLGHIGGGIGLIIVGALIASGLPDTYSVRHNSIVPDNFGNHRTIWTKDRKQKIRRSLTLKSKMELQRRAITRFFTLFPFFKA